MTNGFGFRIDIGIASVGVGILNKDTVGWDYPYDSRIFPAATADNNAERRTVDKVDD